MATATARTIRLRKRLVKIHESRRLRKSIDYLREDIARHAKADVSSVRLSRELSAYVVDKVARHMSPVSITVESDGGTVKADLSQELKRKPAPVPVPAKKPEQGAKTSLWKKASGQASQPGKPAEQGKGSTKAPAAQAPEAGSPSAEAQRQKVR